MICGVGHHMVYHAANDIWHTVSILPSLLLPQSPYTSAASMMNLASGSCRENWQEQRMMEKLSDSRSIERRQPPRGRRWRNNRKREERWLEALVDPPLFRLHCLVSSSWSWPPLVTFFWAPWVNQEWGSLIIIHLMIVSMKASCSTNMEDILMELQYGASCPLWRPWAPLG